MSKRTLAEWLQGIESLHPREIDLGLERVKIVLERLGLADAFGATRVPIYCMNVAYPMIPEEIVEFCAGKQRVLVVEEGRLRKLVLAVRQQL